MIRGTTPTHIFTLPFETSLAKTIKVVYYQFGRVILTKTGDDLDLAGREVQTKLTQEDTLTFDCKTDVFIQLRVLTLGGDALASNIMQVPVGRCLDNEVLA